MLFKNEQGEQVLTLEDMICHFEDGGLVEKCDGSPLEYVGRMKNHEECKYIFERPSGSIFMANSKLQNIYSGTKIKGVAPEKKLTPAEILDLMKQGRIGKTRDGSRVKFGYVSNFNEPYHIMGDWINIEGDGDSSCWNEFLLYYNHDENHQLDILDVFPEGTEFK